MKKKVLFILFLSLIFASCQKEDLNKNVTINTKSWVVETPNNSENIESNKEKEFENKLSNLAKQKEIETKLSDLEKQKEELVTKNDVLQKKLDECLSKKVNKDGLMLNEQSKHFSFLLNEWSIYKVPFGHWNVIGGEDLTKDFEIINKDCNKEQWTVKLFVSPTLFDNQRYILSEYRECRCNSGCGSQWEYIFNTDTLKYISTKEINNELSKYDEIKWNFWYQIKDIKNDNLILNIFKWEWDTWLWSSQEDLVSDLNLSIKEIEEKYEVKFVREIIVKDLSRLFK